MRTSLTVTINNTDQYKKQLLQWAQQFREVVFLDSNNYYQQYTSYDAVLAVDAFTSIKTDYPNAFEELKIVNALPLECSVTTTRVADRFSR